MLFIACAVRADFRDKWKKIEMKFCSFQIKFVLVLSWIEFKFDSIKV